MTFFGALVYPFRASRRSCWLSFDSVLGMSYAERIDVTDAAVSFRTTAAIPRFPLVIADTPSSVKVIVILGDVSLDIFFLLQ
jgi:hypothetical protein